jgi:hypothetical protein
MNMRLWFSIMVLVALGLGCDGSGARELAEVNPPSDAGISDDRVDTNAFCAQVRSGTMEGGPRGVCAFGGGSCLVKGVCLADGNCVVAGACEEGGGTCAAGGVCAMGNGVACPLGSAGRTSVLCTPSASTALAGTCVEGDACLVRGACVAGLPGACIVGGGTTENVCATSDFCPTGAGVCGDGVITHGEQCDPNAPITDDCASRGMGTGPISCDAESCTIDCSQSATGHDAFGIPPDAGNPSDAGCFGDSPDAGNAITDCDCSGPNFDLPVRTGFTWTCYQVQPSGAGGAPAATANVQCACDEIQDGDEDGGVPAATRGVGWTCYPGQGRGGTVGVGTGGVPAWATGGAGSVAVGAGGMIAGGVSGTSGGCTP